MRSTPPRRFEVWADWEGLAEARRIGILSAMPARGKEIFSFTYDEAWVGDRSAQILDPNLYMFSGPQYPTSGHDNFGMFLDSAPDRWGRVLMDRRETLAARLEGRTRRLLHESDYLLGVFDGNRVGGLRFRRESGGPFLDDNAKFASPPWTSLRELEFASQQITQANSEASRDYSHWLQILIAPGGSLGGARPKAGVYDEFGRLWIAKFPSLRDTEDIGAWELLAHTLANRAGVLTPTAVARRLGSDHHTFLVKRFDRSATGSRLHFASAMTLLGRTDGDDATTGATYLEFVEFLLRYGAQVDTDLEQLWRRIVFSICISNVDDHLRNHGFLLVPNVGWVLSPAYDMNPAAYSDGLKLNISDSENAQDLDLAAEVAPFFRVRKTRVREITDEIVTAVRSWRSVADTQGIERREQDAMALAFRIADGNP